MIYLVFIIPVILLTVTYLIATKREKESNRIFSYAVSKANEESRIHQEKLDRFKQETSELKILQHKRKSDLAKTIEDKRKAIEKDRVYNLPENFKDRLEKKVRAKQEKLDLLYQQSQVAKVQEEKRLAEERKKANYDKKIADEIHALTQLDYELSEQLKQTA